MERDEENLSSASFVSTISAASSIHQPRPPDGPKPANQPFRARRSKVVRSPYLATSTPLQPGRRHSGAKPTRGGAGGKPFAAKEKWVAAVKSSGFQPDGWTPSPALLTQPHPSTSSFLRTLMKTPSFSGVVAASMMRNAHRKRTHSATGSALSSGQDAIALGEEIQELKKQGNALTRERDSARAKLRRAETELRRREKEIEDLLAAGHLPVRDATRSLTGRKPDSSAVVSSLRQRIHALERALRQKEEEFADLQRGTNATKVRELQVESETYYQEICRLQVLLSQHQKQQQPASDSPQTLREARLKLKALSEALTRLSGQLQEAQDENKSLREQLERPTSASPAPRRATHGEQGVRGAIADRYLDHGRTEMLSAIVDLEMKLREKDQALQSLCRELEQKTSHYETRLGSLTGSNRDAVQRIEALQGKVEEGERGREKLRNIARKLKEDRTHYRALAEQTQTELQDIRERLQNEELSRSDAVRELDILRRQHEDELRAREHAQRLASRKSQVFTPDRARREAAAASLQLQWRRRQARERQARFQEERDRAAVDIQSALRAHTSRKKQLETLSPTVTPSLSPTITPSLSPTITPSLSPTSEEGSETNELSESSAVETIQSALRGYFTRKTVLRDMPGTTAHRAGDGRLVSEASATSLSSLREKPANRGRRPPAPELWTSELLPNHLCSPWNGTTLEPSSESDMDHAHFARARNATPPSGQRTLHRAPPRAGAVSSNDSDPASPENADHHLLSDELR